MERVTFLPNPGKCELYVYVRDTWRRTGRGRNGFEMHYIRRQCSRNAVERGLCRQHALLWPDEQRQRQTRTGKEDA